MYTKAGGTGHELVFKYLQNGLATLRRGEGPDNQQPVSCKPYCRHCGRRTVCLKKRTKRPNPIISKPRGPKRKPTHGLNRKIKPKIRVLNADERRLINSPLCISYNRQPTLDDASRYKEITPEMIHEAVQKLTEMRESVPFEAILKYLKANYSVNQNEQALRNELEQKLYIALRTGMVYIDMVGQWRLQSELEQLRRVPDSMVTIFWEAYLDTISPLPMKKPNPLQPVPNKKNNDSDSDSLPSDDEIEVFNPRKRTVRVSTINVTIYNN